MAAKSGRPVNEILERFSNENVAEWMAFDRVDCLGDARLLMQIAVVAATIANVNRTKDSIAIRPTDMMVVDMFHPPRDPKEMFETLLARTRKEL